MKFLISIILILCICEINASVLASLFKSKNDTRFFLYTRDNPENPQELLIDNLETLKMSAFNSKRPTKFVTHGYVDNYQGHTCQFIRKGFLERGDFNVIAVDYTDAARPPYILSIMRMKSSAADLSRMIDFLAKQGGADPNNMTLVGFSLGAHLVGIAGYHATQKVGHIVGLDPAGPAFSKAAPGHGLSPSDAQVVEVIHTNAKVMGIEEPRGHIDYYPNGGGTVQPGCVGDVGAKIPCSHERVKTYYVEAVTKPGSLLAVKCKDYQEFLNDKCDQSDELPIAGVSQEGKLGKRGLYFLRTAEESPFGLGQKGLRPADKAN